MKTNLKQLLLMQGKLVYKVRGTSMLPLLREERDLVIIQRSDRPVIGDVVLFQRRNGTCVLHRIIKGNAENGWVICGDNLIQMEPVSHDQILGVMTSCVRNGVQIPVSGRRYTLYTRLLPLRRLWLRIKAGSSFTVRRIKKRLRR